LGVRILSFVSLVSFVFAATAAVTVSAQQPVSRLKGRVLDEKGKPLKDAEVRAEAFFGSAAGTFAGQRTFSVKSNDKGEWNILGIAPGIWLFEAIAAGHLPESVALPVRLLTASNPNAGGQLLVWELVLKPLAAPEEGFWQPVVDAASAARDGKFEDVRLLLGRVPEEANADYLAAAGRVALLAREIGMARNYFTRALDRDPSSYRAALGVATTVLLQREFDLASRAFDAARGRTRDKNEQKFLSYAIGDLATIKVR
jgi:hypothetical protein